MKKLIISGTLCAVMVFGVVGVVSAEETTTTATSEKSQTEKLAKIEQLMKLIAELQAKLNEARGEVKELMSDLREGAEGDDVLKVQELLATDSSLFAVKPTGFFGPKTKEALMKFQERYGLEVTGALDEATREAIKELREDGVKPGLLQSEAAKDRVKARLQEKWGDCDFTRPFRASLCEKVKDTKDDEDDDSDEDEDEEVTRDDARRALVDAQNELNRFRDSIDEMEDEDASDDEIEEAEEMLMEAKGAMAEARRAFLKNNYEDALDASEEVIEILEGDSDDEDEDEDDSDDEDDDSEDED